MTRRLVGAAASGIAVLAGLWLVLAPFALGIQRKDVDWTDQTWTDVATGGGLVLLGVIGVAASAAALSQHLLETGLVKPRLRHAPAPEPAPADTRPPAQEPEGTDGELKALLGPLVSALAQDMERDRNGGSQTHGQYRRETL